jgi:uncharacterized RDD family membrane protein YckC
MKFASLLAPRTAKVVQDASFLRRLGSLLVDIAILDLFVTAPFAALFAPLLNQELSAITYSGREMAAVIALFLIVYAYFVLFEYLLRQTPGMMLLRTHLSGKDHIGAVMLRNSFILPVFPFILFWVIEPLAILFWKRGVLERVSNTRTVHQRSIIL